MERYRVDEDGNLRVRKLNCHRIRGYSTFLPEREYEFPCMEMDGDELYLLAVIGGWFGLHKFKTGHILSGIVYVLSCGVCGVFYISDLVAMLTGDYADEKISFVEEDGRVMQRRERYFNKPVKNKWLGMIGIAVSIVVSIVAVKWIYIPLLAAVSTVIMSLMA